MEFLKAELSLLSVPPHFINDDDRTTGCKFRVVATFFFPFFPCTSVSHISIVLLIKCPLFVAMFVKRLFLFSACNMRIVTVALNGAVKRLA